MGKKIFQRILIMSLVLALALSPASVMASENTTVATQSVEKVSNLTAKTTANSKKIQLTWDKVSGAASYQVYRKIGSSGEWCRLDEVSSTNYTDTDISVSDCNSIKYYYKVRAYNVVSNTYSYGDFSTVKKITPIRLGNVKIYSLEQSTTAARTVTISMTGTKPAYAKNEIWYKAAGGKWTKAKTTSEFSGTFKVKSAGKKYKIKVRQVVSANGKKYYTKFTKAKTIKVRKLKKNAYKAYFGKVSVLGYSCKMYIPAKENYIQSVIDDKNSGALIYYYNRLTYHDHNGQGLKVTLNAKKGSTAKIKTNLGTTKLKCVKIVKHLSMDDCYTFMKSLSANQIAIYTCENGGCETDGYRVTIWKVTSGPSIAKLTNKYNKIKNNINFY